MATGTMGNPDVEYFYPEAEAVWSKRWRARSYLAYVQHVADVGTTPNGVFGVKLMWGYFPHFVGRLASARGVHPLSDTVPVVPSERVPSFWSKLRARRGQDTDLSVHALLESVFPNVRYIFVSRQDKVRQAVSHWKALQTGQWTSRDRTAGGPQPAFDFQEIDRLLMETCEHEAAWQRYFDEVGMHPLTVTYEELATDAQSVVGRVADYLGVTETPVIQRAVGIQKQADSVSEEWVRQYLALKG